jgi:phospholipase C
MMNRVLTLALSIAVVSALIFGNTIPSVNATIASGPATSTNTKTPIKHIVVLFQENVSFDHYFGILMLLIHQENQSL